MRATEQSLQIWLDMVSCESNHDPRFRNTGTGLTLAEPTLILLVERGRL